MLEATSAPPATATPVRAPVAPLSTPFFWMSVVSILALQLGLAFYLYDQVPLVDPDEPRYASAGRTMAEGGSLLIPEFNGEHRINKPPLFYWLVAASNRICGGASEFSARLPSTLMSLVMLGAVIFIGCRFFNRRTGVLAGFILITMPLVLTLSRTCITDMTLSAFVTVTLTLLMLVSLEKIDPRRGIWLAALCMGLAMLTKAVPAFCIAVVVLVERALSLPRNERPRVAKLLPWLLLAAMILSGIAIRLGDTGRSLRNKAVVLTRDENPDDSDAGKASSASLVYYEADRWTNYASLGLIAGACLVILSCSFKAGAGPLRRTPWKLALAIAVLMGVWWYGALIAQLGYDRFKELLEYEVAGRITGQMHREATYYFLPQMVGLAFPWSIGLLGALAVVWRNLGNASAPEASDEQKAERFLLAWVMGIVLFFSVPGAKLATYLLPAMPAMALLIARFMLRLSGDGVPVPRYAKVCTVVLMALTMAAIVFVALNPAIVDADYQDFLNEVHLPLWFFAIIVFIGFGGAWLLALRGRALMAAALLTGTTVLVVALSLPASLDNLNRRSTKLLCMDIKDRIADCINGGRVASVGWELPSLSYYLKCPVKECRRRDRSRIEDFAAVVTEELASNENVALLIQRRYIARMLGIDRKKFESMSRIEVINAMPRNAVVVEMNKRMVVLRTPPKQAGALRFGSFRGEKVPDQHPHRAKANARDRHRDQSDRVVRRVNAFNGLRQQPQLHQQDADHERHDHVKHDVAGL